MIFISRCLSLVYNLLYLWFKQVKMAGELSFLTTLGVEVAVAAAAVVVAGVEGAVVALVVLTWSATSVVSRVILHVNAACVAVLVDVVAAVRLDTAGVQVMVGGEAIK